jgi:gluconokinase
VIALVMGTTAAGKTTVGKLLAEKLGWIFLEADDFHSAANVAKMKQGIPLDDADRVP